MEGVRLPIERRSRKKVFLVLLSCSVLLFLGLYWKYTHNFKAIPISSMWTTESSTFWLNFYIPCYYYRFHSTETSSAATTWIKDRMNEKNQWPKGMELNSLKLSKAIRIKSPSISETKLKNQLKFWSTPTLGNQYAIDSPQPFTVLIRSGWNSTQSRVQHLHIKIFDLRNDHSIIEIWNYWTFH